MRKLEWTHVALIGMVLAVLTLLSWLGRDASIVLGAVLSVLTALGFGFMFNKQSETQETVATIKEQTNGRISHLAQMLQEAQSTAAAVSEANSRALRDQADQHRRDMREMADKLAAMSPVAVDPPVSGGGIHSSNL